MGEQEKDRDLDNLLDSLLAGYSDAQPRPGLETRVMAQLRAETARKKSWRWSLSWMGAGAAASALATVIAFMIHREPVVEPPAPLVVHADWSLLHGSGPSVAPSRILKATHRPRTEHVQKEIEAAADHRPDVFPTPEPLSDQEKLLLRYLSRTPRNEIAVQSHADEPPETAERLLLQIQPTTKTEFNTSTR